MLGVVEPGVGLDECMAKLNKAMKLAACLLAFLPLASLADELIIHGPSKHDSSKPYNNSNYGIGYRTDKGFIFGAYENSYGRPTFYVGRQWDFTPRFGAFTALGTGYDNVSGLPVAPLIGLTFKQPLTDRLTLELMGVPKLGSVDAVVHVSLAYKLR